MFPLFPQTLNPEPYLRIPVFPLFPLPSNPKPCFHTPVAPCYPKPSFSPVASFFLNNLLSQVFQLIRLQQWYTAQDSTYIKLLQLLAKCKQPAAATSLFDSLLQDKLRPTTAIFTALLTVYTESNLLPKAFELFDSMPRFEGCLPDKYTYTTLIKACCNASLYDQATLLFNQMTIAGVEPSIVTYNTLIFGYGKAGLFTEIEHVLTHMTSHNVQPDTVTWNTLIKVFGMHNKIPEMEQAYEGLLAQGLMPDMVTLNSLISAYGRAGLYGKMECVMDYMRRYSYPMDAVTYNTVIELYGKAGRIDEMESKFKEMKRKGVKPTCVTFSSILSAYGKHGRGEMVEKVMRQLGSYVADVDVGVYNAAMDACVRAMDYQGMERWFGEMKRAGIAADEISYGVLVEGYKRARKKEKVDELLEEREVLRSRKRRN